MSSGGCVYVSGGRVSGMYVYRWECRRGDANMYVLCVVVMCLW